MAPLHHGSSNASDFARPRAGNRARTDDPSIGRAASRCVAPLAAIVAAVALASCTGPEEQTVAAGDSGRADTPNVILIVADDLGYGDLGIYGGDIPTPNIDALARSGIRYTAAYASAPICSPSRAGLLSGRFQGQFGFYFNLVGRQTGMPGSVTTIAEVAGQAGYRTAMIGKWHVGEGPGLQPLDQGFDRFFGFLGGATSYFPDDTKGLVTTSSKSNALITRKRFPIVHGHTVVHPPGNLTDVLTNEAVRFIGANRGRPFFLYLAYNAPHTPFEATPAAVQPFADDPSIYSRIYKAMVTTLDEGVGRVIDAVRSLGLEKNTIILLTSDNGCPAWVRGACSNAPLSGWKTYPLEGGIRVPFIVSWPGRVRPGQTVERPVSTLDIMPTIAATLDRSAPPGSEGRNLLASRPSPTNRPLYWRMGPNHWIRQGPWKLIVINKAADVQSLAELRVRPLPYDVPYGVSPLGQWHLLFNLERDIGEENDVSARHPEIVSRLEQRFNRWNRGNMDPAFPSRRTYRTLINDKKVQLIF